MSRHVLLVFAGLFVFWVLFADRLSLDRLARSLCRRHGTRLIILPFVFLVGIFLGIGVWYVGMQGYAGEVEPMISSVSWLVQHGEPLYHPIDSPARYSVLYGPSVYLTNGLFLDVFGPHLGATKLASLLATVLGLFFLYASLAKRRWDPLATMSVLMAVLFFWNQGFSIYLVRPDAFLVFSVSFALMAIRRTRGLMALLAVGTALGFAINLKVHAGLYFLPLLVMFHQKNASVRTMAAVLLALIVVMMPFVFHPQISGPNYLSWLKCSLGHGLNSQTLTATLRYALLLVLPLACVLLLVAEVRTWLRKQWLLITSLVLALAGTLILSSKPGAGLVHLLPLVPVFVHLAGHLAQGLDHSHWIQKQSGNRRLTLGRSAVCLVFLTLTMAGSIHAYRASALVRWCNRNTPALAQDIEAIMGQYKDLPISMACGGEDDFFRSTWLRPLLVFADNPVLIDPIAVMDCRKAGLQLSEQTFSAIKSGKVALWLVPRDQKPFQKANWYAPHDEIFPERFLDHFMEHYSHRGESEFFDLYFWNGLERMIPENPGLAVDQLLIGDESGL